MRGPVGGADSHRGGQRVRELVAAIRAALGTVSPSPLTRAVLQALSEGGYRAAMNNVARLLVHQQAANASGASSSSAL